MFYKMIQNKRDDWYNSQHCTVKELINYIINEGKMRDAQIDAIKTYLFLKIACENKSLFELFTKGYFNSIDINNIELTTHSKDFLQKHKDALSLLEYARLKNENNEQVSEKLERNIKENPESINYKNVFKEIFYGVSYPEYLFSLPMGAGKTYLMAAFIYLDLYFAMNETNNKVFSHNFIIFAPSGLKSSIVPSLKTIKNFNPSWIIPEPSASYIKKILKFELLDQQKSGNKSNKTKNPNVQKIAIHEPLHELFGLVAITNAEKVILDRIKINNDQISFLEESDDDKDRKANELRNLIGKLPNLSIFIDEVHHATNEEIKLRGVINKWQREGNTINSIIGFSGTPYLDKAITVKITNNLELKALEISNIVYYYPLINGINNFLKQPIVKSIDSDDSLHIIDTGVKDFLDNYKDKVYDNGTIAKLAIYCGKGINYLEEMVYPLVSNIISSYGYDPNTTVLKYHGGNKKYAIQQESKTEFESLDKDFSKIKIVLLVQIGKEGWDCRSLTGVILSQKGDCNQKLVLQTSCRCLRQVDEGKRESALIWLNEFNAKKLEEQLQKQHHISITEFEKGGDSELKEIIRHNRMDYLKLPKLDFYQLKVEYSSIVIEEPKDKEYVIADIITDNVKDKNIINIGDFKESNARIVVEEEYIKERADFNQWLYKISKESFGVITLPMLYSKEALLKEAFDIITIEQDDNKYFSSQYNISLINSNVRKCFYSKRELKTVEDIIQSNASLLKIENFTELIKAKDKDIIYPEKEKVKNIINDDNGKLKIDEKTEQMIKLAYETGNEGFAEQIKSKYHSEPNKDKTYHYIPYKMDSDFELAFFVELLKNEIITNQNIEVYYNGDRLLTEFKIKCYKSNKGNWQYVGIYTPDFLIIKRKEGFIHQAIIVETKGEIFKDDEKFKDRKKFMENEFIQINNDKFGYKRFDYLYLEDNLSKRNRINKTVEVIKGFFEGDN